MADEVYTPESATWAMPNPGRRGMNFTKEDLIAALLSKQQQPMDFGGEVLGSSVPAQFGGEVLGTGPNREQQFQQDWDTAMQQYQQSLGKAREFNPTLAKAYPDMVNPDSLFKQIVEPLRFQAAEFSPGINAAFGQKALGDYRTSEIAHQKFLEGEKAKSDERAQKEFERKVVADQFRRSQLKDRANELAARTKDRMDLQRRIAQARIMSQLDPEGAANLLNDVESDSDEYDSMPGMGVRNLPVAGGGKLITDQDGKTWRYKGSSKDPKTDKDPKNWVRYN